MGIAPMYVWPEGAAGAVAAKIKEEQDGRRLQLLGALFAFIDTTASMTTAADNADVTRRSLRTFIGKAEADGWLPRHGEVYPAMHYVTSDDRNGAEEALHLIIRDPRTWLFANAAYSAAREQSTTGRWAREVIAALRKRDAAERTRRLSLLLEKAADDASVRRHAFAEDLRLRIESVLAGKATPSHVLTSAPAYDVFELGLDQDLLTSEPSHWSEFEGQLGRVAIEDVEAVRCDACVARLADGVVRAELRQQTHARRRSDPALRSFLTVLMWLHRHYAADQPPLTIDTLTLMVLAKLEMLGETDGDASKSTKGHRLRLRDRIAKEHARAVTILGASLHSPSGSGAAPPLTVRPETAVIDRLWTASRLQGVSILTFLRQQDALCSEPSL